MEVDPKVRLVVYGFDADQRGGAWSGMIEKLERCLGGATRIRAIGNPKGLKLYARSLQG